MSGAKPPASSFPADTPAGSPGGADPSMEDILASIRRILSEDEPASGTAGPPAGDDDVMVLDSSMMIEEPGAVHAPTPHQPHPQPPAPLAEAAPLHVSPPPVEPPIAPAPASARGDLVAPETAAAVASSVGGLLRTLIAEREQVAVHRGGPTIEDMVREEIRPLLKQWLDVNLQSLVERLVRTEIERVVGRGVS